jgi:DNA repair protein RadA/Sms
VDLSAALAIASAVKDQPIAPGTAAIGEVGLAGEVRPVNRWRLRVAEAARLGLTRIIGPRGSGGSAKGVELVEVANVGEALRQTGLI